MGGGDEGTEGGGFLGRHWREGVLHHEDGRGGGRGLEVDSEASDNGLGSGCGKIRGR